jgi:hypothetical protein
MARNKYKDTEMIFEVASDDLWQYIDGTSLAIVEKSAPSRCAAAKIRFLENITASCMSELGGVGCSSALAL